MTTHTSFIQNYNKYKNKIYSYFFYRLSGDKFLAEDLTADTFCKAYEKKDYYNDQFAFSTWLYKIANNTLIDHFRKNKEVFMVEEDLENNSPTEDEEIVWQAGIDFEILCQKFYQALESCSELQKDVLVLKYLNDYDTKKIAEILSTSPANVRQASSRGIKIIKPILQHLINTLIAIILIISTYIS